MVFAEAEKGEISKLILKVDFENPEETGKLFHKNYRKDFVIVKEGAIAGQFSLKSTEETKPWNEFCTFKKGYFKSGEAYKISLDYKVISCDKDASFYFLVRDNKDKPQTILLKQWHAKPGEKGTIEHSFWNSRYDNPVLILGTRNKGSILVDNIIIKTDPESIPPNFKLPPTKRTWTSKGNTKYYIDSVAGNDKNDGLSPTAAWRSLDKINECILKPGDKVLLKRGSKWPGYFAPHGSGEKGKPILVDAYGEGPMPAIAAGGKYLTTLYVLNSEYIRVSNLDISNQGEKRQPQRTGVLVSLKNFGTAHDIQLKNLYVHDVNGWLCKPQGDGHGLLIENSDTKESGLKSRFDGLLIEGCRIERTDRNGIGFAGYWTRKDWYPNLNVKIRKNHLEDIGGDGIILAASDGAIVEYNVMHKGLQRAPGAAAGIWAWSADNTVIQFNEVSGMKGTNDGQGFDADWNCRNTIIQYNYSHDNDGGFVLICGPGGYGPDHDWNIGNIRPIVRYNISQNDGERFIQIGGAPVDSLIYNNVMYLGPGREITALKANDWEGGVSDNTRIFNNIFYVDGKAHFSMDKFKNMFFENNVFYGNFENVHELIKNGKNYFNSPMFRNPGTATDINNLDGYKLKDESPYLGKGKIIKDNGGRDFWGNKIPVDKKPDIGAFQLSK